MKMGNGRGINKAISVFIVFCVLVFFQNCSNYSLTNTNSLAEELLDLANKSGAKDASSSSLSLPSANAIESAKLTLVHSLVLKPSDYPNLVQNSPSQGLWVDGPPHPWKDDLGNTYVNIPHSENFRYLIGNKNSSTNPWFSPQTWKVQEESIFDSRRDYVVNGVTYHKGGNCTESDYDNRMWLFGFWSTGKNITAIAHHEWYANCSKGYNTAGLTNTHWVNGVHHLTSTNGGKSFLPQPLTATGNSNRLVLVPEPKSVQNPLSMYGFFHPSNIVKEGEYYYATSEIQDYTGNRNSAGDELIVEGFVLVRTRNINSPVGWELFDSDKKWTIVARGYQGNLGQKPYIFFPREFNPYVSQDLSSFAATNLRFHMPSQTWLAIGVLDGQYTILQSASLANPQFDLRPKIPIQGVQATFPFYISAFDPNQIKDDTDFNYMKIGNELILLHMKNYEGYAQYSLTLTIANGGGTTGGGTTGGGTTGGGTTGGGTTGGGTTGGGTTGGGTIEPTYVITYPLSPMKGFFKVGDNIYLGGIKTYCYIGSMDQYKSMTNSYDISIVSSVSSIPAGLSDAGGCGSPVGVIFVGQNDIYYIEKNEYCHIPSMELYGKLTNNYPIDRIPRISALPSSFVNRGYCQ